MVKTALMFISHVSLQVHKKPVSMFTTHPVPVEVPMFSVVKFPQPTHIAVERANGYHAFDHSSGRSHRRRISGLAMDFVNGHESFFGTQLSWCSVDHWCQLQICADVLLGFRRAMVNRAFGTKSIFCLLRSNWSLRWLHVCICSDASEKGFAFAVRDGCRELAAELGRVSERIRFWNSSSSIGARSRALRSIAPDAFKFGLG